MKRDKSISWRRVDPESIDLTGMEIAVVGGTGGIGPCHQPFFGFTKSAR